MYRSGDNRGGKQERKLRTFSIIFALIALGTGLVAAWYWYASTKEQIDPAIYKAPDGREAFRMMEWVQNVMNAVTKASQLNSKAALWTAAAVLSSAISAIFSAFSSN